MPMGKISAPGAHQVIAQDLAARLVDDVIKEGAQIVRRLKADHVIGRHRPHQFCVRGKRGQDFHCREGCVQEKTNPLGHVACPQFVAQRDQVVVVHPDQVIALEQGNQLFGELPVDLKIARRVLLAERSQVEPVMKQRP
jgi:hypothetical protein